MNLLPEPNASTETVKPVRPKVRVGIFEDALRDWPTAPPSVVAQPNAAVSRNWRLEMFIALPPEFLSSAYLTRRRGSIIQKRPNYARRLEVAVISRES